MNPTLLSSSACAFLQQVTQNGLYTITQIHPRPWFEWLSKSSNRAFEAQLSAAKLTMTSHSIHVFLSFVALFVFSMAVPDVYSTFEVSRSAPKGQDGSCQGYPDIQAVYREAIEMAQASLDALKTFDTVPTVKATARTFFGIKDSSSPEFKFVQGCHEDPYLSPWAKYYPETYQAMIDKSNAAAQNKNPAFFCDDSYAVHTETWYDPKSGAKTQYTYADVSSKSGSRLRRIRPPILWRTIQATTLRTIARLSFTDTSLNSTKRTTETERGEILVDTVSKEV